MRDDKQLLTARLVRKEDGRGSIILHRFHMAQYNSWCMRS